MLARVAFGEAEIHDMGALPAINDDVRRFDVPMDDAVFVGVLQSLGQFDRGQCWPLMRRGNARRFSGRSSSVGAVDVFANQKPHAILGLARIVERHDRRMLATLGCACGPRAAAAATSSCEARLPALCTLECDATSAPIAGPTPRRHIRTNRRPVRSAVRNGRDAPAPLNKRRQSPCPRRPEFVRVRTPEPRDRINSLIAFAHASFPGWPRTAASLPFGFASRSSEVNWETRSSVDPSRLLQDDSGTAGQVFDMQVCDRLELDAPAIA